MNNPYLDKNEIQDSESIEDRIAIRDEEPDFFGADEGGDKEQMCERRRGGGSGGGNVCVCNDGSSPHRSL